MASSEGSRCNLGARSGEAAASPASAFSTSGGDLLFGGARHTDGRGFDKEENRPHLQIPLRRQ